MQIGQPDQSMGQAPADQSALVPHPHLAVEVAEVTAHRIAAELVQGGDLTAVVAAGHRRDQLLVAAAQLQGLAIGAAQGQGLVQPLAEQRIKTALAPEHHQQGVEQLALAAGLQTAEGLGAAAPDPLQPFRRHRIGEHDDKPATRSPQGAAQLFDQRVGTAVGAVISADHQERPRRGFQLDQQLADTAGHQAAAVEEQGTGGSEQ